MKKFCALISFLLLTLAPAIVEPQAIRSEVRSASGKLLYTTRTSGKTTEFRSPSGKLLIKTKTHGEITEVRSPSERLLQRLISK